MKKINNNRHDRQQDAALSRGEEKIPRLTRKQQNKTQRKEQTRAKRTKTYFHRGIHHDLLETRQGERKISERRNNNARRKKKKRKKELQKRDLSSKRKATNL
jgi:hypothetical protein